MRSLSYAVYTAALLVGLGAPGSVAAQTAGSVAREMEGSATTAGRDAAIYQWTRVNREVDRVVAGEHRLERLLPPDAAASASGRSLWAAVSDLRAARSARDPKRTAAAARRVAQACQPFE